MTSASSLVALILGLTGPLGQALAAALARRGWKIRALTRRSAAERPHLPFPVDWLEGDALDAASVQAAAAGTAILFHGVNPPGYRRWREDGLPMLANSIAAARASGATILFPANVYVFSTQSPRRVDELAPRLPTTRKGKVRLEMEQMLEDASRRDGVKAIALRAGDFFGPGVVNSWFTQALAKDGLSTRVIRVPARPGAAHAWAYVPDLAEAFARLVDVRASLPTFTLAHFAGHTDVTGLEMAHAVRRATGWFGITLKPFPWLALRLAAPFVPGLREVLEMEWLWKTSLVLDNTTPRRLIGQEPHTPLDDAVRAALARVHSRGRPAAS
jgi:nucleoside-diphosphate-sugar epimerase